MRTKLAPCAIIAKIEAMHDANQEKKKSDTQRVPVARCHSSCVDTIISLKVITVPFSLHGFSISSLGRFVNP